GRALPAQGGAAGAEAASHDSEALAGVTSVLDAAITWRGVRAEALAERGEHADAVQLARGAVDMAAATDGLLHHADARLALAATLRAAGRRDEADAEGRRAIELWEAKGATVLVERARRGAGRVSEVDRASDGHGESMFRIRPGVRPNAATANAARFEAAIGTRDADAIAAHLAGPGQVVDHTTGAAYDRKTSIPSWLSLLKATDGKYVIEPLATLGAPLAMCRQWVSGGGGAGRAIA